MVFRYIIKVLFTSVILININVQSVCSDESNNVSLHYILTNYDAYVKDFIIEGNIPGAAIAVVVDSEIVFIKGYGVKKVGEDDPIDTHSVFRIASVSKTFASVLTGLLVREGVLDWDDKVSTYLPDFSLSNPENSKNLTIRHILSHTSGLIPHAYDNLIEANVPFSKIMGELNNVKIMGPVGQSYGYQNTVYNLITEIIESATHQKYTDVLMQRLTQPLGMRDVSFTREELNATDDKVCPHRKSCEEWVPTITKNTYYNVPAAAGINASIYDMALWLRGMLGGMPDVLPAEVVADVCKPEIKTPYERRRFNWERRLRSASYGLGWRIFDYAGHTMVFHSGGLHGFRSYCAFLPERNIGIVVLQNSSFRNNFVYKFMDMYLNLDPEMDQIAD